MERHFEPVVIGSDETAKRHIGLAAKSRLSRVTIAAKAIARSPRPSKSAAVVRVRHGQPVHAPYTYDATVVNLPDHENAFSRIDVVPVITTSIYICIRPDPSNPPERPRFW